MVATLASCAGFSEPYSVSVSNDLLKPITLAVCNSHDCSKVIDPWVLKPGQTGRVNVEVNGGYNPAILLGPGNSVVGCLPFRLSRRPAKVTVRASQAVGCDSSGGVNEAHGGDWPPGV
jgi:hypothetical protein